MDREGLHVPAWSCGMCRELWREWRHRTGRTVRDEHRGPGEFEVWADGRAWIRHADSRRVGVPAGEVAWHRGRAAKVRASARVPEVFSGGS
jgi:hypothetical protein